MDAIEQGSCDFQIDPPFRDGVEYLVECGEASLLGVERFQDDVALEASAMPVVKVALDGIAQRGRLANFTVGFDVGAGAK